MMIGIGIPRSQRRMPLPIATSSSKSGVKTTSAGFAFPLIRHSRATPPAVAEIVRANSAHERWI